MNALATALSATAERRVLNETGLNGRFNVNLSWPPSLDTPDYVSLFTAVQEQLGLKLAPSSAQIEWLVVEWSRDQNQTKAPKSHAAAIACGCCPRAWIVRTAGCGSAAGAVTLPQEPPGEKLANASLEVVSVKENPPTWQEAGGPSTRMAMSGQFTATRETVRRLIAFSYDVRDDHVRI